MSAKDSHWDEQRDEQDPEPAPRIHRHESITTTLQSLMDGAFSEIADTKLSPIRMQVNPLPSVSEEETAASIPSPAVESNEYATLEDDIPPPTPPKTSAALLSSPAGVDKKLPPVTPELASSAFPLPSPPSPLPEQPRSPAQLMVAVEEAPADFLPAPQSAPSAQPATAPPTTYAKSPQNGNSSLRGSTVPGRVAAAPRSSKLRFSLVPGSAPEQPPQPAAREVPTLSKLQTKSALYPSANRVSRANVSHRDSVQAVSQVDLDELPKITLPGYTPYSPSEPPTTAAPSSAGLLSPVQTLFRSLSRRRRDLEGNQQEQNVGRKRSLVRPERSRRPRQDLLALGGIAATNAPTYLQAKRSANQSDEPRKRASTPWTCFTKCITCWAPNILLEKCGGMTNPKVRMAWREKMALVTVILFACILLGFITLGFEYVACGLSIKYQNKYVYGQTYGDVVVIRGDLYDIVKFKHPPSPVDINSVGGKDVSWIFPNTEGKACDIPGTRPFEPSCEVEGVNGLRGYCHTPTELKAAKLRIVGQLRFTWEDVRKGKRFLVFNSHVLDLDRYFKQGKGFLNDPEFDRLLTRSIGTDATLTFVRTNDLQQKMECLLQNFRVGVLDVQTAGCFVTQTFMWVSLATVLALIVTRFILAVVFSWLIAPNMGNPPPEAIAFKHMQQQQQQLDADAAASNHTSPQTTNLTAATPLPKAVTALKSSTAPQRNSVLGYSRFSSQYNSQLRFSTDAPSYVSHAQNLASAASTPNPSSAFPDVGPGILRTIMLVTCYSEDEAGIRCTLDSLARTDFPDSHKMLFIIADGLITGSGNSKSTPDILVNMITLDPQFPAEAEAYSYVAIADGKKRHNMAKVYAGRYHVDGRSVPAILVVKCGTPDEAQGPKPGNRGKRDSQLILMQFLSKVMFNDRLTPLEFDLFTKITAICGPQGVPLDLQQEKVTPDQFELVLMVDADTKVDPNCMLPMSYVMYNDPKTIGLCGETRIANKTASFTTAIQVFEYYLAHYLSKSFESLFGGVTCLPGCFCMYRIKAPKGPRDADGNQYYVPILANPDIVEAYSQNVVETLHEKNLLLLGEDRYLSTLMLRTFPKRHQVFLPKAFCKTVVPDEFKVLVSQRRRWINSTFHNLMELILVRDLCGIFCFSMQFVIFLELVGTMVLPAAILFTIFLLVVSFFLVPPPIIPLILLAAILLSPALLIVLTAKPKRWGYLFWMILYIIALPIWNFILPVYAYWHFDDFSWGETRKLEGAEGDKGHGDKEGEFDHTKIVMRRWVEYEQDRRKLAALNRLNGEVGATTALKSDLVDDAQDPGLQE